MRQSSMFPTARGNTTGWRSLAMGAAALVLLSACQAGAAQVIPAPSVQTGVASSAPPSAGAPAKAADTSQAYTAKLEFSPSHAEIGQTVQMTGSGYPAGANVDMVWYTVQGHYELKNGTEFQGQRYEEQSRLLTTLKASSSGEISSTITVPQDFGGSHDVRGRIDGKEISQAGLVIDPTFSINPKSGPIGTMVELRVIGTESRINSNTWHVLYDNHYVGFASAVTTNGVAVARFRAAGPVGMRNVSIWHNSYYEIPYLNFQQGPYKDVPTAKFTFNVTSDDGLPTLVTDNFTAEDNPWPVNSPGSGKLSLSADRGAVGTPTTLRGTNLPANSTLTLGWQTVVGNRVSASGFTEQMRTLGTVQTAADGSFTKDITIPDDLGGQHRIDLTSGEKVLASASLVIQPSVISISPTKVRAGELVNIHLKGIGWTTYDNTYAVTYDDSYIGYVCGFNTNGDVQFTVTATGVPGTHLIDLYPTIYKGADAMPRVYSIPQLTYADDHPQRKTPAIRFAILITE